MSLIVGSLKKFLAGEFFKKTPTPEEKRAEEIEIIKRKINGLQKDIASAKNIIENAKRIKSSLDSKSISYSSPEKQEGEIPFLKVPSLSDIMQADEQYLGELTKMLTELGGLNNPS